MMTMTFKNFVTDNQYFVVEICGIRAYKVSKPFPYEVDALEKCKYISRQEGNYTVVDDEEYEKYLEGKIKACDLGRKVNTVKANERINYSALFAAVLMSLL